MAKINPISIEIGPEQIKQMVTVNVKFDTVPLWNVRLWIAARLIRFGAWVAGVNYEIELEKNYGDVKL
jgi:hypothetical protein